MEKWLHGVLLTSGFWGDTQKEAMAMLSNAGFRRKTILSIVCAAALCASCALLSKAPRAPARTELGVTSAGKIDLRLLYVGHPVSAREADFVGFLKSHFEEVTTGDLAKFGETDADGFDVVILDYDGDGFKAPRARLKRDYSRATVTVGVVGAFICNGRGLKTGYL